MIFENENNVKKLDSVGRLVIPKTIRYKAGIPEGGNIAFYYMEKDGKKYICLTSAVEGPEEKYKLAAEVLRELGESVPESLSNLIG